MDNLIGKKLDGRYEIQEIIGIGGMAVVYKAYDSIDDRIVAIKILKDEYLKNDEFRRRFKNESKAVAVLSHPNIVKVYDVSFGDRIQYIVMEYIDGITLKEYIDQQKVLSWKETVHFTVQILRALSHAHERGIVHRDIKPQNIMMLEDGTIKVTDFGIARFAHSETHTMTDKAIGSVHYISPEQARGSLTDAKSDIYSVGVMLYEMLTGTLPFEAESAVSVAIMQMQETPQNLRTLNPEVPEGLEEITLKAMRKDPEQRYQTAADMLDDIEQFKENPSIRFAYKYFVDESPTKYVDAINEVKTGTDKKEEVVLDKNGKPIKKKKKLTKSDYLPILAGCAGAIVVLVALIVLFTFIFKGGLSSNGNATVPNIVGMQLEDAQKQYSDFTITQTNTSYDPDAAKGEILTQTPEKGTSIKEQGEIKVTVSLGAQSLVVPDVAGMTLTNAKSALADEGFTNVVVASEYSDDYAADYIIGTSPASGEQADSTDEISIRVSKGKDTSKLISVPSITGLTEELAKRNIQDAGLVAGTPTEIYSDTVASGIVISQSPNANTQVAQNSTVDFTISKGQEPASSTASSSSSSTTSSSSSSSSTTATLPKVIGLSYKDARNAISNAGFKVTAKYEENDDYVGTAIRMEIDGVEVSPGTTADTTKTVVLYVGKASATSSSTTSTTTTTE